MRKVLSSYFPKLSEPEWVFEFGPHGRPELATELVRRHRELEGLRFSLSHTDSLYALLVARDIDCGVDVETTTRNTDLVGVGKRSFASSEFALFEQLDGQDQRRRFFEYWTLKESYIKAIGTGLVTPLRNFWFDLPDDPTSLSTVTDEHDGATISVTFDEVHDDASYRWSFGLHQPTPDHQLAWAVSSANGEPAPGEALRVPAIHMRHQPGARRPVLIKWLTE